MNLSKNQVERFVLKGCLGAVLGFLGLIVLVSLIVSYAPHSGGSGEEANANTQKQVAPALPKADYKETIGKARTYMARKDYEGVLMELDFLSLPDRERPEAQKLYSLASSEKGAVSRRKYADEYEKRLLTNGADATVRVGGRDSTTLNITYVLINRPFLWNMENNTDLTSEWKSLGFTSVHLSDGFDSSWSFKLN